MNLYMKETKEKEYTKQKEIEREFRQEFSSTKQ